jgi:hypothetical protein
MLDSMSEEDIHNNWPSNTIREDVVRAKVDEIYREFILDSAPTQICFPHDILERTAERTKRLNYYGPGVFTESLFDPIKTLRRDIYPRFSKSQHFAELKKRMKSLEILPSANELSLPLPPSSLFNIASIDEIPVTRRFSFNEIVDCAFLVNKFMIYLQKQFCSENLICYRMIRVFEERLREHLNASDEAWDIYIFFVAEGSAYEVSLDFTARKNIMLGLANAKSGIFSQVERSVMTMLNAHFAKFQKTAEYENLAVNMREEYVATQEERRKSSKAASSSSFLSCFSGPRK